MSTLRWIAVVASVIAYRVWFPEPPLPAVMHLHYDLLVIALIGLHRGVAVGTMAGWLIGFLSGAPDPGIIGWSSLLGATLGWVVGYGSERMFLEYAFSRWLVLWLVLLIARLLHLTVVTAGDGALWMASIWTGALASAGLTATVGAAVSLFWERARPVEVRRRQRATSRSRSLEME